MSAIQLSPFLPGPRLVDGNELNRAVNLDASSCEDAITAHAGGGQPSAYQLTAASSRVSVCASGNDSVALPQGQLGQRCTIRNDGAQNLTVYAKVGSTDTINGTAGATGVTVGNGKTAILVVYSMNGAQALWAGPVALA